MQKNKEEKYAGDLNVEIDEIKKVMTEKKNRILEVALQERVMHF